MFMHRAALPVELHFCKYVAGGSVIRFEGLRCTVTVVRGAAAGFRTDSPLQVCSRLLQLPQLLLL